jgi:hypothetical protein
MLLFCTVAADTIATASDQLGQSTAISRVLQISRIRGAGKPVGAVKPGIQKSPTCDRI